MACQRRLRLLIAAMDEKTNRALIWGIVSLWLFLPGHLRSGTVEDATGTVKGTITIGGRATSDALVSVEGLANESVKAQLLKLKNKRFVMDQREVKFIPRVLAVAVGSTVDFLNSDKTFHNVFSTSEIKKFDLGLYSPGRSRTVTFDQPGVVKVLCHVHPHMEAFIVVKEHPFFGVTDNRGNYQLENIPLGKYRLEIWHPEFGSRVEPFAVVRDREVLNIDVDLKRK
jgi:plastocyanin